MELRICTTAEQLGESAAVYAAKLLNDSIKEKGSARLLLSTGASQFETLKALCKQDIDWSLVEMFHLDEYIDLPETHKASFRKYLKERFLKFVPDLTKYHLIDGKAESIAELNAAVAAAPIDVGLIGIGENAHIAFNDPPADFECEDPYKIVTLNDTCKKQQVGEGWFKDEEEVPNQAISMTVKQIMKCEYIVSCVPFAVKATAVFDTLKNDTTNMIPATMLKNHPNFVLYLDNESASKILV